MIADRVFTMDVAAQLVPTVQNTVWGGVGGKQYGVVASLGIEELGWISSSDRSSWRGTMWSVVVGLWRSN